MLGQRSDIVRLLAMSFFGAVIGPVALEASKLREVMSWQGSTS
jgi:hypothetical protein